MPYPGVRCFRPRPWIGLVLAILVTPVFAPAARADQAVDDRRVPPVPHDLLIAPDDRVQDEALSHFAWGLFLHLQDEAAAARAGRGRRPGSAPTLQFSTGEPAFPSGPESAGSAGKGAEPASAAVSTPPTPDYIAHYREALKRAPDNPDVLQLFASAVILAYDPATLARELDALLAAEPAATSVCLLLAELQFRDRKRAEACKTLAKGIEASGWADVRLVRQLCDYLVFDRQFDEAEKWLARARRKGSLKNDFTLALATALFYQEQVGLDGDGKSEREKRRLQKKVASYARDALEIAEESNPDNATFGPEDGLVLVRVFHAVTDYGRALKVVAVCRKLFPDADGELDVWEVESLLKLGRKEEASARLADLEKRASGVSVGTAGGQDLLPPAERRLREYEVSRRSHVDNVNLGRLFLEMEKPKEAVAAYERALKIAPADYRLRFILGQLYLGVKQPAKTIDILAPVVEMPQRRHWLLSHAYYVMEKLPEAGRELALAEEAAKKAEDKAFFDPGFYLYYATVCEESGYADRAIEKARKALELAPEEAEVQNFLGYVLADHDRELPEALKLIEKAVKAEAQNPAFLDSMGWVLYRLKRFDDALDWIRRAVRYSGDQADPVILDHAGDICAALQMREEAQRYWEQAIAAGDKHPEKIREKIKNPAGLVAPAKVPSVSVEK